MLPFIKPFRYNCKLRLHLDDIDVSSTLYNCPYILCNPNIRFHSLYIQHMLY